MPRGAKILLVVVKVLAVVMFLLPLAGIVQHAFAVHDAEETFNKRQAEHQRKMNKMIKDYNDGQPTRVRASTVANP